MKQRSQKFFIADILNSINKILKYTNKMDSKTFLQDEKTIDAVERNFEIIGEAVKNLSKQLKEKYPNIPFKQIAGMRDKLIHDYFGVDYEIVFETIKTKLPEFKRALENINHEIEV